MRCLRMSATEFGGWAKLRIIEAEYALLAKFRGESTLPTYLNACISTMYQEYRVSERGRWRPSAAAIREGRTAVRLETLVRRDGLPFQQAVQVMRTSGVTDLGDRALAELLSRLPDRSPAAAVDVEAPPADAPANELADDLALRDEARKGERCERNK